jgi:hypothetical protein
MNKRDISVPHNARYVGGLIRGNKKWDSIDVNYAIKQLFKVSGLSKDIWNHSGSKEQIKKLCIKHKLTVTLESHVTVEAPLEKSRRLYQLNFETNDHTRQISITSYHKGGLIREYFCRMDIQYVEGCRLPVPPTTFDTKEDKPEFKHVPFESFVKNESKFETFTGESSRSPSTQQNHLFKSEERSENSFSTLDVLSVLPPVLSLALESTNSQSMQNGSPDSHLSSELTPPTIRKVPSRSMSAFQPVHYESNSPELEEILGQALKDILYETIEEDKGLDFSTPPVSPTTVNEKEVAATSKYLASPELTPPTMRHSSSRYTNSFKPLPYEDSSRDLKEILGEALKNLKQIR